MASLLPLIQDILPMILPSAVHIAKADEILPSPSAQEEGANGAESAAATIEQRVISRDAIVNKTDKMCATVLIAKPNSSSGIHHHGEQDQPCKNPGDECVQDAIIFAASGKGVLLTGPSHRDLEPKMHELVKGDFAFVPAWTEHQVLNQSEEEDLMWVVFRTGPSPVEVNLTGWQGPEAKSQIRK